MPTDPDEFIEKRSPRRGAAHIGRALLKRPQDFPRYARHTLTKRQSPLELGLPWMPYSVIDFLDRRLDRNSVVVELGSGGSTLFFADRAGRVITLEENDPWASDVGEALAERGFSNVDLRSVKADFGDLAGLGESEYWRALPTEPADVIVVDSSDYQTHEARPLLFRWAEEIIRSDGVIVVDDAWRYRDLPREAQASRVESFRGLGPGTTRPQWSDVYFY